MLEVERNLVNNIVQSLPKALCSLTTQITISHLMTRAFCIKDPVSGHSLIPLWIHTHLTYS